MKANLNLGRISGIKIKIHWTFFFLIAWIVFDELKRGGNTKSLMLNIFMQLSDEQGISLLVVTHDEDFANKTDRIIQMGDGKIII